MAYKKEYYQLLKEVGFTSKQAHIYASYGKKKIQEILEDKVLSRLQTGEKLSRIFKAHAAKIFGFTAKETSRLRSFSNKNLFDALKLHALPEVGELAIKRAKDNIIYENALLHEFLIGKARRGTTYIYKVEFTVMSPVVYFREKKYATVVSNKKLTQQQVTERVLEQAFQGYEEMYNTVPDPTSIKIVQAYYMTPNQYKTLEKQRMDKRNERKNPARNHKR